MPETVVGPFRTRGEPEAAMRKLEHAGSTSTDISIVSPRPTGEGPWWANQVFLDAIRCAKSRAEI